MIFENAFIRFSLSVLPTFSQIYQSWSLDKRMTTQIVREFHYIIFQILVNARNSVCTRFPCNELSASFREEMLWLSHCQCWYMKNELSVLQALVYSTNSFGQAPCQNSKDFGKVFFITFLSKISSSQKKLQKHPMLNRVELEKPSNWELLWICANAEYKPTSWLTIMIQKGSLHTSQNTPLKQNNATKNVEKLTLEDERGNWRNSQNFCTKLRRRAAFFQESVSRPDLA